ncbi:hypothetical protein [Salinivibrio kushneri]|uniref:Uncharacterized protein n=1 Tax=Salinivibrio kushneri TaxID=1908198 RepID=A0AB36K550_9GAMM|nr:hypothetical protein [Salinivibrio kushneri]OOE43432.1 hypothetical protein BZG09_10655 [Salinivibrio kushneri]
MKIAIAYVGPKEFKRDTITGSRQVFPQNKPIEVSEEVAAVLLRFDKVFVEADQIDDVLKAREAKEQARKEAEAKAEEARKKAEAEACMVVTLGGEEIDLNKLTGAQVTTLVESHDLGVIKEPQEKVDAFKKRVREAIQESEGE